MRCVLRYRLIAGELALSGSCGSAPWRFGTGRPAERAQNGETGETGTNERLRDMLGAIEMR